MNDRASTPLRTRRAAAWVLAVCMAAAAILTSLGPAAGADPRKDLEAAQHRAEKVQRKIDREERVVSRVRDVMNELAGKIEEATSELQAAADETQQARAVLGRVRARLQILRERLNERVADAFMFGFPGEVAYLLDSASMSDMTDRILFVESVAGQDVAIADEVDAKREELAEVEAQLAAVLSRRQAIAERLHEHRRELERQMRKQDRRLGRLDKLHGHIAKEVGELTEKVRVELLALGGDGILGPLYRCPVDGPVAYGDTFGMIHHHPGWTHKHQGNDLMAALGTPVVAPFDGYATNGAEKNAGIYVTVRNDEGFVQMMHLLRLGALGEVKQGDVVGWVGVTGNASSPHVHFEWHPGGGAAVDPYPQLNEVC